MGFKRFGEPVPAIPDGNLISPYVLDLDAAREEWKDSRPKLLEFFLRPLDGVG
jgi:hypothetical protein